MRLLALVDALRDGTLNESQQEAVQALRTGILELVERDAEAPPDTGDDEPESSFDNPGSLG